MNYRLIWVAVLWTHLKKPASPSSSGIIELSGALKPQLFGLTMIYPVAGIQAVEIGICTGIKGRSGWCSDGAKMATGSLT